MYRILIGSFVAGAIMLAVNLMLDRKKITTKITNLLIGYLAIVAGCLSIMLYDNSGGHYWGWVVLTFLCWLSGFRLASYPPYSVASITNKEGGNDRPFSDQTGC